MQLRADAVRSITERQDTVVDDVLADRTRHCARSLQSSSVERTEDHLDPRTWYQSKYKRRAKSSLFSVELTPVWANQDVTQPQDLQSTEVHFEPRNNSGGATGLTPHTGVLSLWANFQSILHISPPEILY
jgi:hypothetical protein